MARKAGLATCTKDLERVSTEQATEQGRLEMLGRQLEIKEKKALEDADTKISEARLALAEEHDKTLSQQRDTFKMERERFRQEITDLKVALAEAETHLGAAPQPSSSATDREQGQQCERVKTLHSLELRARDTLNSICQGRLGAFRESRDADYVDFST